MAILIISGIALIIVSVVLFLKKGGDKKINYKDRIKLENILENVESNEKDVKSTSQIPAKDSSNDQPPTANIQDDSAIKLTDDSIKYYNKGVALFKEKKYDESISYLNTAIRLNSTEGNTYYYRGLAKQLTGDISGCCKDFKTAFEKGILDAYQYMKKFCD